MKRNTPIVSTAAAKVSLSLNTSFAVAKGQLNQADNVVLSVTDAEGRVGIGEAAPFPVFTADTQDMAYDCALDLLAQLGQQSPLEALSMLHEQLWAETQASITALVAVELALYDLYARQQGVSLSQIWGKANLKQAQTDMTLPIMKLDQVALFWQRFGNYSFPYWKIKVGASEPVAEVERIKEFLKCAPTNSRFFLDGNQGYTVESALKLLALLEKEGLTPLFFEQPLAADDWEGMTRLSQASPVPICADETVRTLADCKRLINTKAARMINLKFTKSGIKESLQIAKYAKLHGINLMIGGMLETEILMTSSLHAVCGSGLISWCDLDTPFFINERLTIDSPYHHKSAVLKLPEGTGLGLTLKNELLGTLQRSAK